MPKNPITFPDGLVEMSDYLKLVKSESFHQIEIFSDEFVEQTKDILDPYSKKWVKDPLHQWSRQWEYPYVIGTVNRFTRRNKNVSILDLGSGITFLPYYLKKNTGIKEVIALDYDQGLEGLFTKVNRVLKTNVRFIHQDIRELEKSRKQSLDFIYCVSVLEHTDQYPSVIKSCHRLLRKGGYLCLTFDISLDGHDDIPVTEAKKLLGALGRTFKNRDLEKNLDKDFDDVITSKKISKIDKRLMPWKYPFINIVRPALKLKGIGSAYKNLTFCCITVEK